MLGSYQWLSLGCTPYRRAASLYLKRDQDSTEPCLIWSTPCLLNVLLHMYLGTRISNLKSPQIQGWETYASFVSAMCTPRLPDRTCFLLGTQCHIKIFGSKHRLVPGGQHPALLKQCLQTIVFSCASSSQVNILPSQKLLGGVVCYIQRIPYLHTHSPQHLFCKVNSLDSHDIIWSLLIVDQMLRNPLRLGKADLYLEYVSTTMRTNCWSFQNRRGLVCSTVIQWLQGLSEKLCPIESSALVSAAGGFNTWQRQQIKLGEPIFVIGLANSIHLCHCSHSTHVPVVVALGQPVTEGS